MPFIPSDDRNKDGQNVRMSRTGKDVCSFKPSVPKVPLIWERWNRNLLGLLLFIIPSILGTDRGQGPYMMITIMTAFGKMQDESFACVERVALRSSALIIQNATFILAFAFQGEREREKNDLASKA